MLRARGTRPRLIYVFTARLIGSARPRVVYSDPGALFRPRRKSENRRKIAFSLRTIAGQSAGEPPAARAPRRARWPWTKSGRTRGPLSLDGGDRALRLISRISRAGCGEYFGEAAWLMRICNCVCVHRL